MENLIMTILLGLKFQKKLHQIYKIKKLNLGLFFAIRVLVLQLSLIGSKVLEPAYVIVKKLPYAQKNGMIRIYSQWG